MTFFLACIAFLSLGFFVGGLVVLLHLQRNFWLTPKR
jgi:hypothetical protein